MFMSVKGGCGKSTLSFYAGLYLSEKFEKRVYYVDTDLLASTSKKTILGSENCRGYSMSDIAINGLLDDDGSDECFLKNFVNELKLESKELGLILCDSSEDKRKFFRGENQSINTAIYKGNLKKLFAKIRSFDKDAVCVIDMPPATDNYSDCLVKLMLEEKKNNRVVVCHVTTDNYVHIVDTLNFINEFYNYDESREIPDNIILMVNVLSKDDLNQEEENNLKSLLESLVAEHIKNKKLRNKICCMVIKKDSAYLYALSATNREVETVSLKEYYSKGESLKYSNVFVSFRDSLIDLNNKKNRSFYNIVKGE